MKYRILFRSTATKTVSVFVCEDYGSERFYRFLTPQGLAKGEYEYYICSSEGELEIDANDIRKSMIDGEPIKVLDCGMAQVGKIVTARGAQYNIHKTYKEYGEN